jgi:hypothetical protein
VWSGVVIGVDADADELTARLGILCKSAWQPLREMFQQVASDPSALPGVVISVQSFRD